MTDRLNARIAIPLLAVVGALSGCGGGDTGNNRVSAGSDSSRSNVRDAAATFHGNRVAEHEQHVRCVSPHRRSRQRYATGIRSRRVTRNELRRIAHIRCCEWRLADVEVDRPADPLGRQSVWRCEFAAIQGSRSAPSEAEGELQHRSARDGTVLEWREVRRRRDDAGEGLRPFRRTQSHSRLKRRLSLAAATQCSANRSAPTWTTARHSTPS